MLNRKSVSKRNIPATGIETKIIISTQCPKKWMFVDIETGEIYKGSYGDCFEPPTKEDLRDIVISVNRETKRMRSKVKE